MKKVDWRTIDWESYFWTAFIIFVIVGSYGWCVISGIMNLVGTGEVGLSSDPPIRTHISGNVIFADSACEYAHTLNGIFPLGKEYYYLIFDENGADYCVVRAKETWLRDNFDGYGFVKEGDSVEINGIVKEAASGLKGTLVVLNAEYAEYGIEINTDKYVDLLGYQFAWESIVTGILLVVGILFMFVPKQFSKIGNALWNCGAIVILVSVIMLVRCYIFS